MGLTDRQEQMCDSSRWNFSDLKAIFLNCTLKRSSGSPCLITMTGCPARSVISQFATDWFLRQVLGAVSLLGFRSAFEKRP